MKDTDIHKLMERDRSERQKAFREAYFGDGDLVKYCNDSPDSVKGPGVKLFAAHIFAELSRYYAGTFELLSHKDIRITLPDGKKFLISVREEQ